MVGKLIKLLYSLNVSAHDSLLLLEHTDVAVYLSIAELVVLKVSQRRRYLVLALVVEKHVEGSRVIINLELCPHRLLYSSKQASAEDDVVNWISVELTNVVRTWLRVHHHANCHRSEYFGLSDLSLRITAHSASVLVIMTWASGRPTASRRPLIIVLLIVESCWCVVCKHFLSLEMYL